MSEEAVVADALLLETSRIHGVGMFTGRAYAAGERIACIRDFQLLSSPRLGSVQIAAGAHVMDDTVLRWINHSCLPSAAIRMCDSVILLEALHAIPAGEEITCDYEATEDVIPAPFLCRCSHCADRRISGAGARS